MSRVDAEARFTSNQVYTVVYKKLFNNSASRSATETSSAHAHRHAGRVTFRVVALRFSDHRGLLPSDVKCAGGSLQAKLSRSKTLGADREVQSRPAYIDQACFIASPGWIVQGWDLLTSMANFERDNLMPSPSENFQGCIHKELCYDTAFAIQHRVLFALSANGERLFDTHMPQFWTLHSGRAYLPSATGVTKRTAISWVDGQHKGAMCTRESQKDVLRTCRKWWSTHFKTKRTPSPKTKRWKHLRNSFTRAQRQTQLVSDA